MKLLCHSEARGLNSGWRFIGRPLRIFGIRGHGIRAHLSEEAGKLLVIYRVTILLNFECWILNRYMFL
jgi:hypothetical protein